MRRRLTGAALCALAALPALGHDFWIEPSSFHPSVSSELAINLRVGQDFRGDPVPRDDRRIVRFVLVSPGGERAIPGLPATDPAGLIRIEEPGFSMIGYRSSRSPVTLEPEKFEKYLSEEGLEKMLAIRGARGDRGKPGKEVFSRCAKSLVAAGGVANSGFDRTLGFTLELVAEKNPRSLGAGGRLPVRLLYEGKPLQGVLVVAMNRNEPERKLAVRTDWRGRAALRLARSGVWLVKAVHMVAAPPETGADWESLWASLTFEVP